jgi:peptidyl-prolyl cis-trans isomerase C
MRRLVVLPILAAIAFAIAGCANVEQLPVLRLTDNEGVVDTRTVSVGYVNGRLERVPIEMIPDVAGDEGKRQFMDDIIRKELLVIYGMRIGILEDERFPTSMKYFEDSKAEEMLRDELIVQPAQVTPEEVEDYYGVRDDLFQLREMAIRGDEELAQELYTRITEGGEDFARLARDYSVGGTAEDGGLMPPKPWVDFHPLTRVELRYLDTGDFTPPHLIGETTYFYQVVSRKDSPTQKPLDEAYFKGVAAEARNFKRNMLEYYVFKEWDDDANLQWNDEAVDILGTRIDEEAQRVIPQTEPKDSAERMERARMSVIPKFKDDAEANMVLVTYNIFGDEKVVTLADYAKLNEEVPGIETVKTGDRQRIETFMRRIVQRESIQAKIDEKGYRTSEAMKDYLEQRKEEFIIDITYEQEVAGKVDEPLGQEIRDQYRNHLDRYVEPAAVDIQQIMVGTEAQANRVRQRLLSGEATFTDLVQQLSIDDWSKAKDGIVEKYHVGERRLDYLQNVAFDLGIGEISEPVRAPGGYAIVKVLKTYPERQMPFDEVSGVVKQSVINQKREARLMEILDEARNTITIEYVEENFKYINDPVEVRERRMTEDQASPENEGQTTFTIGA